MMMMMMMTTTTTTTTMMMMMMLMFMLMLMLISLLRICYLENLKPEDIDRKCFISMKYFLLRNAFHMSKEERLRTRYRKVK
jgi:hypothetical protein